MQFLHHFGSVSEDYLRPCGDVHFATLDKHRHLPKLTFKLTPQETPNGTPCLFPPRTLMTTIAHHQRYHGVARQLVKLPRELVFPIIGDLTLIKILELICRHELPYIEECILGHIDLRQVFTSPGQLNAIKSFFKVYLLLWDGGVHDEPIEMLKADATTLLRRGCTFEDVLEAISSVVERIVRDRYRKYHDILEAYSVEEFPIPFLTDWRDLLSTPEGALKIVEAFMKAEVNMGVIKSKQLDKMADLIIEFPGTMRTRGDVPSQEKRAKWSEAHTVERLRLCSKRMPRSKILVDDFVAVTVFAFADPYLVPYDRLLRGFLKVLAKYPHERSINCENPYAYPDQMAVVMKGLQFVYDRKPGPEPELVIYRTKHTTYGPRGERKSRGNYQPTFISSDTSRVRYRDRDYDKTREVLPMAEEELEWLEAFLGICRYMSNDMGHVPWKEGQSVSEYWQIHVGPV